MTGSNGRPLESLTESQTAGPGGPITLQVHPRNPLVNRRSDFNRRLFEVSSVHVGVEYVCIPVVFDAEEVEGMKGGD